jgi:hypothetical protein
MSIVMYYPKRVIKKRVFGGVFTCRNFLGGTLAFPDHKRMRSGTIIPFKLLVI